MRSYLVIFASLKDITAWEMPTTQPPLACGSPTSAKIMLDSARSLESLESVQEIKLRLPFNPCVNFSYFFPEKR
jgi:hypothetical protein